MRHHREVAGAAVVAFMVACGTLTSNEGGPPTIPGPPGTPPVVAAPCSGKILYVSAGTGDDAHEGCTKEAPKRTIGNAIAALAAQADLSGFAIEVCKGTYSEPRLRLDRASSLHGGYDCVTWTRSADFGDASATDPNEVVITNASYSASTSTFEISGALGADVVIDGLTILGAETGESGGIALAVTNGAAPAIANVHAFGGQTHAADGTGSIGISIASGAAPTIRNSLVRGGGGVATSATSVGSVGILVDHGAGTIVLDTIDAGSGRGGDTGGYGIRVIAPSAPMTIDGNQVRWTGELTSTSTAGGNGSVGIELSGGVFEVSFNTVIPGTGACEHSPCTDFAMRFGADVSGTVHDNIIAAPVVNDKDGKNIAATVGLSTTLPGALVIIGNVVLSGDARSTPNGVLGIDVSGGGPVTIAGNTIVTADGPDDQSRTGVRLAKSATASIDGNIFVGNGAPGDRAILTSECLGANTISSLKRNVVVTESNFVEQQNGTATACPPATAYPYPAQVDARFGAVSAENLEVTTVPLCSGGCKICSPGVPQCQKVVYPRFNPHDLSTLKLDATVSCAIAQINPPFTAALTATPDLYQVPRTPPFSAGASESNDCAQ